MAVYKVRYSGFTYVEADSIEEAEEMYHDGSIYEEEKVTSIKEVDEDKIAIYL